MNQQMINQSLMAKAHELGRQVASCSTSEEICIRNDLIGLLGLAGDDAARLAILAYEEYAWNLLGNHAGLYRLYKLAAQLSGLRFPDMTAFFKWKTSLLENRLTKPEQDGRGKAA